VKARTFYLVGGVEDVFISEDIYAISDSKQARQWK